MTPLPPLSPTLVGSYPPPDRPLDPDPPPAPHPPPPPPRATPVVGSSPQPDWLVDRARLRATNAPRVRVREIWRVDEPHLQEAQDDATLVAIRDMERAGIDTITDGEIRRESYSN